MPTTTYLPPTVGQHSQGRDTMTELDMKIMVLGDIGVGKTALLRRYVDNEYNPDYKITVDLDFKQKQMSLEQGKLNLQLWDVPGNERFGGLTSVYYKYSHGAIVTFDLARRETFLSAAAWLADYVAAMELGEEAGGVLPVVLVGNKADVENVNVADQEYVTWVEDNKMLAFYQVSARDNTNVDAAVKVLIDHILATDSFFSR